MQFPSFMTWRALFHDPFQWFHKSTSIHRSISHHGARGLTEKPIHDVLLIVGQYIRLSQQQSLTFRTTVARSRVVRIQVIKLTHLGDLISKLEGWDDHTAPEVNTIILCTYNGMQ